MLLKNKRHVLFFDLAMSPHPSDAPTIELDTLLPFLEARCKAGEAVEEIDKETRIIRLSATERVKLADGSPAIAMLFTLGDRDKADPGVTNFDTGAVRVFKKGKREVGGLSVHVVTRLTATKKKGHLYRTVIEDVTGFGRTPIQSFLRGQFRIICDDNDFTFFRDDKRPIKTRPMLELSGHASEKLKNSLAQGRLLNFELVNYEETDFGMDEGKYISTTRRNMNLSVSKELPKNEALSLVKKVQVWARRQGYDTMRVRWKEESTDRPQTAKMNTAKADAGEALFIKTAEVSLKASLPEMSAEISDELVSQMMKEMA